MKTQIIIGLGYGDEGKGLTTDYLCRQSKNPLVIRFSGGHQAGHTVVRENGDRHVFSSLGAGTLQGAATYWSRFCTFYPAGFYQEYQALQQLGYTPDFQIDALSMVTTPYDIFYNRAAEKIHAHGSCGLGFGATMERNEGPHKLYVQDLFYPIVVEQKLAAIAQYYHQKTRGYLNQKLLDEQVFLFKQTIENVLPCLNLVHENTFFKTILKKQTYDNLIFEGSQGILLDMDFGFFPNVTRANTTTKNAIAIIKENNLPQPKIFYITRAYQTRHGNGFLSNTALDLNIRPNPHETNQFNEWQGHQRHSVLDVDVLNYALGCDANYSGDLPKYLVVTCLDQVQGKVRVTKRGELMELDSVGGLLELLDANMVDLLLSYSDVGVEMVNLEMQ